MSNHENLQAVMQNPNFQMLEQVVSERNNAVINHKVKKQAATQATFNQMANTAQKMQQTGNSEQGDAKSAPNSSLTESQYSSTSNNPPSALQENLLSTDQSANSNPANWPNIQGPADSYNQAMFNYFILSTSGGMDNPNSMFDFLQALVKMLGDNDPSVQSQMKIFTGDLANARSPNPITGEMGTYAQAIASIMTATAIYNAKQEGGNPVDILNQMKNSLGGASGNPFINQIQTALGNPSQSISNVQSQIQTIYGPTGTINKNILSFMMENVALNSQGLDKAKADYKKAYIQNLISRNFEAKKNGGANAMQLLQFLIAVVSGQQNDQIGSFGVTINALSAPGTALGEIKNDIAPTDGLTPEQSWNQMSDLKTQLNELQEYENSPIMIQNGISQSIKDAIKSVLNITVQIPGPFQENNSPKLVPVALNQLLTNGTINFPGENPGDPDQSVQINWNNLPNWNNPSSITTNQMNEAKTMSQFFSAISAPESNSDGTDKINQSYQDAVNALAVPEQKISGVNDMEKTLFTNANQQASQSLSTEGGIIKDMMKEFSLMVQNQKA